MISTTILYLLYRQSGVLVRHVFATTDKVLADKWKELKPRGVSSNDGTFTHYNGVTEFILVDGVDITILEKLSDSNLFTNEILFLLRNLKEID